MQQVLLFVLLGLGSGALIAGIALAVVLTYRGSGVINLATGAVAMLSGYAYWSLKTGEYGTNFGTAPALVITFLFTLLVGALIEFVAFRPLRNASPLAKLVSSLGVLLVAQASMLLAFGTTQKPQPSILPSNTIKVFGSVVPIDRLILAGIVIAIAIALAALYHWSRFGLATRAASENELNAMLGGLSANELALGNTLLASVVAGAIGVLASSVTQLDTVSLPLQVVPALAAALLARLTSFGIACAAGLGIGILNSLIDYFSTKSWFPTDQGVPLPGVKELVAFLIIILAMYVRGATLPGRGELVEQRLPEVPRPGKLALPAIGFTLLCAVALIVLPFDFRQALINSLIGTVMALSLVVITGFVGQISVVQLALAGVAGFTISHLAVDAGLRGRPRPGHRDVGPACARGEPRGGHARRDGRDRQLRLHQQHLGRRRHRLAGSRAAFVRARPRSALGLPRARRQPAESGLRLGGPGGDRRHLPVRGRDPAGQPG
jgi:branched-chain amino acid transport system permease protein